MSPIDYNAEAIAGAIKVHAPGVVALLPQWCAINSGSTNLVGLGLMRLELERHFSTLPVRMDIIPLGPEETLDGQPLLVGHALRFTCRPEAEEQLFLCGHYDTVYEESHAFQQGQWLDANTFNAPGAIDMKGGLLTLLLALRAFEELPGHDRLGWELLIVPDEEIGSPGSIPLLREVATRHRLALVFEPAMSNGNCVRRRMGVGSFQATVTGRAAHTGRDFANGRNAIAALSRFLLKVEALNSEFPQAIFNTGFMSGGGAVNVVPDTAVARFNMRVEKVDDIPPIRARVAQLVEAANREDGIKLEWRGSFNRPPKEINPATEAMFRLYQSCALEHGVSLDWTDSGGGSDGSNLAAAGITTLDGVGPRGGNLHSEREYILVDSIAERAAIATSFMNAVAEGALHALKE
ncbi:MAG: hydrolase [Verrucomicrobiota bacterium]|nr:hydrolase [Verrucomicrobiota bacterium]